MPCTRVKVFKRVDAPSQKNEKYKTQRKNKIAIQHAFILIVSSVTCKRAKILDRNAVENGLKTLNVPIEKKKRNLNTEEIPREQPTIASHFVNFRCGHMVLIELPVLSDEKVFMGAQRILLNMALYRLRAAITRKAVPATTDSSPSTTLTMMSTA